VPAKPLTAEQHDDARRLKAALARAKSEFGLTQAELAARCGWDSQSSVSQYANGKIPLNVEALGLMCLHLRVSMSDISPTLSKRLSALVQTLPKDARGRTAAPPWPFVSVSTCEWDGLSLGDRHTVEQYIRWVINGQGKATGT
jgi:transcriptional regulator with XRE-family HTH domain